MSSKPVRWTPIDPAVARNLTNGTSTRGVVYPVGTNAVPQQLQTLPGAVSCFVSNYVQGVPLAHGLTAGGEMVVAGHEGDTGKAYNHVFASSNDGGVHFGGMYKGMAEHHFASSSPVQVERLFGNPLTKTKP